MSKLLFLHIQLTSYKMALKEKANRSVTKFSLHQMTRTHNNVLPLHTQFCLECVKHCHRVRLWCKQHILAFANKIGRNLDCAHCSSTGCYKKKSLQQREELNVYNITRNRYLLGNIFRRRTGQVIILSLRFYRYTSKQRSIKVAVNKFWSWWFYYNCTTWCFIVDCSSYNWESIKAQPEAAAKTTLTSLAFDNASLCRCSVFSWLLFT